MASQAAVLREWNAAELRWDRFMYYSYRGKDGILPGLRLATLRDGRIWTRQYNEKDPRGMGQIFQSTPGAYYEWHLAWKNGHTYVLTIEVGTSAGKRWRPVIAVSQHPETSWTQLDVDALLFTRLDIRFHGALVYIEAYQEPDPPSKKLLALRGETREQYYEVMRNLPTHLCRLRHFRGQDDWSVAFYTYSHDRYEPCVFANGSWTGSLEDCFDIGATYLV
jgi:hypothetical protein